jgi:uncharacterized protein (TIGR03067 family)
MRTHTLLLAAVALGFAPAPPPRPNSKADLKAMQGAWLLTTVRADGQPETLGRFPVEVEGNRVRYLCAGRVVYEFVLALDAARSPKRYVTKGTGPASRDWVVRGIYSLEGDTLKFCYNDRGESRPQAFDGPKRGKFIQVWKREAKR